jgi:hypothetical protein
MTGIPAQSPAKGWGAFDPGLDRGEECAKGGVRLRGPSPWSGEEPERQAEEAATHAYWAPTVERPMAAEGETCPAPPGALLTRPSEAA